MTVDPYAPPRADLETPAAPVAFGAEPRLVGIGRGYGWVAEALRLVFDAPWTWIAWSSILLVASVLLAQVPYAGEPLSAVASGLLVGGMMLGAHGLASERRMPFARLFAGCVKPAGPLVVMSLVYAALAIAVTEGVVGGLAPQLLTAMRAPEPDVFHVLGLLEDPMALLAVLLAAALYLPLSMAYWFAPALIVLQGAAPFTALYKSLVGCAKNFVPFLWCSVVLIVLFVVAMLPLFVGLFIAVPTLMVTIYTSFRDVYRSG